MTSQTPIEDAIPLPGGADLLETPDDASAPQQMDKRLWVLYPLAMIGVMVVWGGVMQVLLGKQVAAAVPGPAASAAMLGLTLSLASVSGVISTPIAGWLSDITRTKFLGRRNVWIFGSSVAAAAGLVVMSQLTDPMAITIVWALLIWPLNSITGALSTVLPERVPERFRGRMGGIIGGCVTIGGALGVTVAGLSQEIFMGYLLIAGIVLICGVVFAFATNDRPAPPVSMLPKAERKAANKLPGFRAASDYWWAFAGRFLLTFGYASVVSFQLFILRDYIGVGDVNESATVLVGLTGLSSLLGLVFALVGGTIADKLGRLRIFVGASTFLFVPAGLVYIFMPTITGAYIATGIIGIAYGVYLAVDAALVARVLPNINNAGRDLGIMNLASSLPQIVAPGIVGLIVGATGNYQLVFVVMIIATALGALSVKFIKGVR